MKNNLCLYYDKPGYRTREYGISKKQLNILEGFPKEKPETCHKTQGKNWTNKKFMGKKDEIKIKKP